MIKRPHYLAILFMSLVSTYNYAFCKNILNLGMYSGLYSQAMGGKANLGIKSGFEMQIMEHLLILPQININFPNEKSQYPEEKITLLKIDGSSVVFPRYEFGLCSGYKYRFAQLLTPFITAGMTYGTYVTPHYLMYNEYGIPAGEIWGESRLFGNPFEIGNYFEINDRIIIKCHIQITHFTATTIINYVKSSEERKRGISIGEGASIVCFIWKLSK
jgi:hypothetical protein